MCSGPGSAGYGFLAFEPGLPEMTMQIYEPGRHHHPSRRKNSHRPHAGSAISLTDPGDQAIDYEQIADGIYALPGIDHPPATDEQGVVPHLPSSTGNRLPSITRVPARFE